MKYTLLTLMESSNTHWNFVGEPVKSAAYYLIGKYLHTVQVTVNNLKGRIFLEGTLSLNPTEDDWFEISIGENGYVEYDEDHTRKTDVFTFIGSYTFIRARLDRSYLPNPDLDFNESLKNLEYGTVEKILLSY